MIKIIKNKFHKLMKIRKLGKYQKELMMQLSKGHLRERDLGGGELKRIDDPNMMN
jgi:hypothetical protein